MTDYLFLPRTPTRTVLLSLLLTLCLAIPNTAVADGDITCDSLNVSLSSDKNYYIFTATTSGATTAISGYTFNFGDKQSYTVNFAPSSAQSRDTATVTHTYQDPGSYTPTVQVATKNGSKTASVTSPNCQADVTIQSASGPLPDTGATDTPQIFIIAVLVGIALYQLHLRLRAMKA